MKKSFTLIEILVVTTIIGFLFVAGIVSYSQLTKGARDAKRKTDLEQLRSALEMYKSNVGGYPDSLQTLTSPIVYIQVLPQDPKPPYAYYYHKYSTTDYTIGSHVETGNAASCLIDYCTNCNYCIGPYGEKTE